ncbi:TPA: hypothetical protein ACH3X1_009388 [Trebouxia sp. C0004]
MDTNAGVCSGQTQFAQPFAVGISYLLCIRCGTPWWQDHWWVVAMTVVAVMVLAEVAFVCHTLFFEQQILLQSGEQTSADVGVNTPLLFRPDDGDNFAINANV